MGRLFRLLRQLLSDDSREIYEAYKEQATLRAVKVSVQVVSILLMAVVIIVFGGFFLMLLSFALALLMGKLVESYVLGFLIVAGLWAVLIGILIACRKTLIVNPLVLAFRKLFFRG